MHIRRATTALVFVVGLGLPSAAAADDKARADEQFEFGLGEMQAGRYDAGCPALAESYKLDPAPGALFTLAACEAQWGRLGSAVRHYERYLSIFEQMSPETRDKQKGRDKTAASQLELLKAKAPKLTITVSASSPPGTTLKLDGVPLDGAALGTALLIDPGDHVVTAETASGEPEQHRVSVRESEHARLHLDLSGGGAAKTTTDEPAEPDAASPDPSRTGGVPTGAYVAGGVGLVGIAIGTITGFVALGQKSTIDEHCPDRRCDAEGRDAVDSGQSMALVSTIGFGVGVVGLATGAVLLLTAPSSDSSDVAAHRRFNVGSKHVAGGEMLMMEASW